MTINELLELENHVLNTVFALGAISGIVVLALGILAGWLLSKNLNIYTVPKNAKNAQIINAHIKRTNRAYWVYIRIRTRAYFVG